MQNGNCIEPLLPAPKPIGKNREVNLREVVNAIFYRADNGIKWRVLPCDFPAWQTVYGYYRVWVKLGVWEQVNGILVQRVREADGRESQPSLVIIDSQSVKLGQKGGTNTVWMDINRSRVANAISWSMS
jgi:transposase